MTPASKKRALVLASTLAAFTIIIVVYWVNGAEKEDAWLYIMAAWIVLIPAFDLFFKKDKKTP